MSIDGEFSLGVDGSCSEGHELRLGGRFLLEYGWGVGCGVPGYLCRLFGVFQLRLALQPVCV